MKAYLLSFLIFFNTTFCFANLNDNEVIKKYKEANSIIKPDLYGQIHETADEYWKDWHSFENYILNAEEIHQEQGMAYMISGAVLTVLTGIGYSNAQSSTEEITYSLAQSLSIGAMGFGAYKYYIGDFDRSFYYITNSTEDLTEKQRNQLVYNYSHEKVYQKGKLRWITMATYGLIAAANFINAARADDETTADVLYTIGGLYTLAFLSVTF